MSKTVVKTAGDGVKEGASNSGIKINVRFSSEYQTNLMQSLQESRQVDIGARVDEAVKKDVAGFVEYVRAVHKPDTSLDKIFEYLLSKTLKEDKTFQEWKKKNPQFFYKTPVKPAVENGRDGASSASGTNGSFNGLDTLPGGDGSDTADHILETLD